MVGFGILEPMTSSPTLRIGTWNLQGRWDGRHLDLIDSLDCDILLLTEVSERVAIPGRPLHTTVGSMARHRWWAAIASRSPLEPLDEPHGATAAARIDGLVVCSGILPWRNCGTRAPWEGASTADKTIRAVDAVATAQPSIWGGDWNHALSGREWGGSIAGRHHLLACLRNLELQVPTADQPHQIDGLLSIDHIAVPNSWVVTTASRHRAFVDGVRLSDHDAYGLEVSRPGPS